jgi:mRNA-degrading endonuclease RelE of RelBE toxin-antitoxin system
MMDTIPVTVRELPRFTAWAEAHWDRDGIAAFVDFIARNPIAGAVIPGTGGLRKIRWAMPGKGKRGGARVIYYYHDADDPLTLLAGYAKAEKADLTTAEKKAMSAFVEIVKALSRGRK